MDRRERFSDIQEALRVALTGWQAHMWTALPCLVQSFDADKQTCVVQPLIQAQKTNQDGTTEWINLPLLSDVPVVFMGGGGYTLTFPVQEGDEALVVFSSRPIDNWWYYGGIAQQSVLSMHDLSDGFAIIGPRNKNRIITDISTENTQLRSDDGQVYIEMATGHIVNIVAPGGINITGPVHIDGDVDVVGNTAFTGEVAANTHRIDDTHRHSGVTAGLANTGVPL